MSDIDLNLLRVFDILYDECNVTRAAGRLGLTQPAVSHALARLRKTFNDPLFIRAPAGLQPTERAHELMPRLRAALAEIRGMVTVPEFDPVRSTRRFTIWTGSYSCAVVIPNLIMRLRKTAPNVTLHVTNVDTNIAQALDQRSIDLVLGSISKVPAHIRSEVLFCDEMAWIVGAQHPLARGAVDRAALLALPRIAVERRVHVPSGNALRVSSILSMEDDLTFGASFQRAKPQATVYDATTAIAVAAASDMAALVPHRYAKVHAKSNEIKIIDFPGSAAETLEISMLWHSRMNDEPASQWLRNAIRETVRANIGEDLKENVRTLRKRTRAASA